MSALPALFEEIPQQPCAVLPQHIGEDGGGVAVVFPEKVDHAAAGAGQRLSGAEDHPGDAALDDGAGAHGAGAS